MLEPEQADYFWVPHKYPLDDKGVELAELLHFLTQQRPWFNASLPSARHILAFSCDHGPHPCFWPEPPCDTPAGHAKWAPAVNPASSQRGFLFLQPSGVRDGADTAPGTCCQGCFQNGKDISLPPMTPGREWNWVDSMEAVTARSPWLGSTVEAEAFVNAGASRPGAPERDISLWFAGSVVLPLPPGSDDRYGRSASFWAALPTEELRCPHCTRAVGAARFAPHLQNCLGKGRNSQRAAKRGAFAAHPATLRLGSGQGTAHPVGGWHCPAACLTRAGWLDADGTRT